MYVTCYAVLMTCTPLDHQPASRICCSCPHLNGLLLADSSSPEEALGIEMLSEADFFWKTGKGGNNKYVFHTSLKELEVPPPSSAWSADWSLYPKEDSSTVVICTGYKRQGSKRQCAGTLVRKIKTVKTWSWWQNICASDDNQKLWTGDYASCSHDVS